MFINLMQDHGNQVSEKPFWVYCVHGNGISSVSNTLSCAGNFHQEICVSNTCKAHGGALPRDFTNNNLILFHFAALIYAIGIIEVRSILLCQLSLIFSVYKKTHFDIFKLFN